MAPASRHRFLTMPDPANPAATAPDPAPACSISHYAVRAADVDVSLAFYRDRLGLSEAFRLNHADGSLMLVVLRVGTTQWIEIFDGKRLGEAGPVLHQVAFRVADGEASRQRLAEAGFSVPETCPRGQMRNAYLLVPDAVGHTAELVHYLPEGWPLRDLSGATPDAKISRIARMTLRAIDPTATTLLYRTAIGAPPELLELDFAAGAESEVVLQSRTGTAHDLPRELRDHDGLRLRIMPPS
jgi:catechol 2,3-dioxygenase-like lactoylglutathione lyase family enzyme